MAVSLPAHVHRLGGKPDGVNTNHRNSSRRKLTQPAALSAGQVILTGVRGCWISRQMLESWACDPEPAWGGATLSASVNGGMVSYHDSSNDQDGFCPDGSVLVGLQNRKAYDRYILACRWIN